MGSGLRRGSKNRTFRIRPELALRNRSGVTRKRSLIQSALADASPPTDRLPLVATAG